MGQDEQPAKPAQQPPPKPETIAPNPSNFEKRGGRPWGGGQANDNGKSQPQTPAER